MASLHVMLDKIFTVEKSFGLNIPEEKPHAAARFRESPDAVKIKATQMNAN
jgi:hypothetical protein